MDKPKLDYGKPGTGLEYDLPKLELPEKPEVPETPETLVDVPEKPVEVPEKPTETPEIPRETPVEVAGSTVVKTNQLPNTGDEMNNMLGLGVLVLVASLGLMTRKKEEDA